MDDRRAVVNLEAPPREARVTSTAPRLPNLDLKRGVSRFLYRLAWPILKRRFHNGLYRSLRNGLALVVIVEGWDAGGKSGTIKRLFQDLHPDICTLYHSDTPTAEEENHSFLWRYEKLLPKPGHVLVLDRSWYGRVLIERVEHLAAEEAWRAAYDEINAFEAALHQRGVVVVKFWLQIDSQEQYRRLMARRMNPAKRWKLSEDDFRNYEQRQAYEAAAEDMFAKTASKQAPWVLVAANSKRYARLKCLSILRQHIRQFPALMAR